MKWQAHDFQGQKKVGEDDGGIDAQEFPPAVMVTSAASAGFLQISKRECCLRTARYSGM